MTEFIKDITQTTEGYPVQSLKWNSVDNIIVGLVKDPIFGNPNLRDGFICVQWNKYGKPIKVNKGRTELIIKLNYETEKSNTI